MKEIYSFRDDYSEGAHPQLLEALQRHNNGQTDSYGNDRFCQEATRLIRGKIKLPDATVHFVSGGTQANLLVLDSLLRPHESVIAVSSAHIAVHETGSIESTGHKINLIPTTDGKLSPGMIDKVLARHHDEHMVMPRVVFISQTTELGTIYSKNELTELSEFCGQNELLLYLDGARLSIALTADTNKLSLSEIAKLVDVFYIGGTKNGALIGEAIVFSDPELQPYFRYIMKQKGGLLAKSRIFGIQFKELFTDEFFLELGRHANQRAYELAKGITSAGFSFSMPPVSNQLFPVFPDSLVDVLKRKFKFHIWEKPDEDLSVVRLVTSWATPAIVIDNFIDEILKSG